MSDYQAIYDAVRSRVSGGDVGQAVSEIARQAFDISWEKAAVRDEAVRAFMEIQRPSAVYRPALSRDGNQWCVLYGPNLVEGVAGFGDTPADAMAEFDQAWHSKTGVAPTKKEPQ